MIDSFTTMTTIAAVLAGTSVYATYQWHSIGKQALRLNGQIQQSFGNWDRLYVMFKHANRGRYAAEASMESMAAKLIDAEDKLRQIETKRHNSAKYARGVQLAKAKALRDTKTSELRRDLEASLAEPERQAA